jgi:hypothetical protein
VKNSHGAIYVHGSNNSKIMGSQGADATYVAIEASCPSSCPLKDDGCYAQTSGFLGKLARRLNDEAEGGDANAAEVAAIDAATPKPGRALRLHVSGDCSTTVKALRLASAVGRWKARGGGAAWNYTHAWLSVHRKAWGKISVLASIENPAQARYARKQGYAPALIVTEHASPKAFVRNGVRWIPCPAQTREIGCTDCRLCFDADALYARRAGIAFAAHGAKRNDVKRKLPVIA